MEYSEYCWPKNFFLKSPRVVFFEASCQKHDEYYSNGWNEVQRLVADLFFLTYMLDDINKYQNKWYKKLFYVSWALLYFILVRLLWWLFFIYK